MDAMWEARGSAFKVVEERWKTFEEDGEMVSQPGERRIPDRELETLQRLWTLAEFVATDTFDEDVDDELVLDVDGEDEPIRFEAAPEVTN